MTLGNMTARRVRGRAALLVVGGATLLAVPLSACGGGGEAPPAIVVQVATSTPTATPTASPTPTPSPTPETGPIQAERIPLGESAGLVNIASTGFPAPAPSDRVSEPNEAGILRVVSPSLGLDHYIQTIGVSNGALESPDEDGSHAVGWYASDARYTFGVPRQEGNIVLSAHETWNHMQGPFYRIHQARVGEDIYLDMADGERRHYQVARVTRYAVDEMPMREVLWPSDRPEREEWLTFYTCGGDIQYDGSGFGKYAARDVLVAKWVGSEPIPDPTDPTDLTVAADGALDDTLDGVFRAASLEVDAEVAAP